MSATLTDREYFVIDKENLKGLKIFPFHLFVYNSMNKKYSTFLFGNSPLTKEKEEVLDFLLKRGGKIAVSRKQKKTFLSHLDFNEEDITSLKMPVKTEYELKRDAQIEQFKKEKETKEQLKSKANQEKGLKDEEKNPFSLVRELETSSTTDNFMNIIEAARNELVTFPLNISHTVSLAGYLAGRVLNEDNLNNRIAAVSYFLAKNLNLKSYEALADLICAALFHHLGYSQIDRSFLHHPFLELSDEAKILYQKHPGLTHHLLKKCRVELSENCQRLILEHHERYDGRGYPNNKMGQNIALSSLILGAVSHIFEYSSGRITGSKVPLKVVLRNLKNKSFTPGLEFEFGHTILNELVHLLNTEVKDVAS